MPLSHAELERLFLDLESDRVERKAAPSNPDQIREAICAFANDMPNHGLPGVIFLGQNDDGTCSNLRVDDGLLLRLSNIRDEGNILPLPVMQVGRRDLTGCTVAVVVVEPSDRPPARFRGRTCIRVGPRRAVATLEEERRLTERQLWRNLPFDSRPFSGATLDDLDLYRFETEYVNVAFSRAVVERNGRNIVEKLRSLRLISPDGVPTAAAILLLGKDPRAFLPGAYIQFLRVEGKHITDPIEDQKEISGTVQDQIRMADEVTRINVRTRVSIGPGSRGESPDYPVAALDQLIRNALLHRNYDSSHAPVKLYWFNDRIEIHNSGGLYGDVTPETIWKGATAYRNPLLAEGMKALGLVERFGFGLQQAQRAVQENGNPPLRSEFVETFVAFIVERHP